MRKLDLFIELDTGTDTQPRWIINPLFILMVDSVMAQIRVIAKIFGIDVSRRLE